jgi:hypothetical protein
MVVKDGPLVWHKKMLDHIKSGKALGSTGVGDVNRPLVSVGMFFKRYVILPKFVGIVFRRFPNVYYLII